MKSFFTKCCPLFLLVICQANNLEAQLCLNGTIFLDATGTHDLTAEDVLTLQLGPEYEVLISPDVVTCAHIGEQTIEVNVVLEGDTVYHCTSHKFVDELVPPAVQCAGNLHITLDGFGPHVFTVDELDNGSFDVCSDISYQIIPDRIQCGDVSPKNVTLRVTDASGNTNSCVTLVTWEDFPGPISSSIIECKADLIFELEEGEVLLVTADMLLDGGPNFCADYYTLRLVVDDVIQTEPILTIDDSNAIIQVFVQDPVTLIECWGFVDVQGVGGCEFVFNVCDTKCNSEPFGDCASGHTDQDDVEWPCDLTFTNVCQETYEYPTPEQIVILQQGDSINSKPMTNECLPQYISMGYNDQVVPILGGSRIIRTWSIFHWESQITASYLQNIYLNFRETNICDTQPWTALDGDCDSGHTLSDDIEWPADITIESLFTHPDDLELNPLVLSQNARPQLFATCNPIEVSYQDLVIRVSDTIVVTERIWSVIDFYANESWEYLQRITSWEQIEGSIVCVTRENGEPIHDVQLIPGISTDGSGCYAFSAPDGITVIPTKDSPLKDGVNLLDVILLREHILGLRKLSEYQQRAADMDGGGGLSTLDLVRIEQMINGTLNFIWPHNWRFYERITHETFADISNTDKAYKFIGVKLGDIDNSYALTPPDRDDSFLKANDEVLNSGETYYVPFYPDRSGYISGYAISIKNENQSLDFLGAEAINLPGFSSSSTVLLSEDGISIIYLAPAVDGAYINELEPLFILEIKANTNVVLHEEITMETTFDNMLKPMGDEALNLKFTWENVIINAVVNLDHGRVYTIYPNPVQDQLIIKGITPEDKGTLRIIDVLGRVVYLSSLHPMMDVSHLNEGLFYVTITMEDGKSAVVPLYKTY